MDTRPPRRRPFGPSPLDGLAIPRAIGSRELKTRLGTYLRLVKEGVTLVVTERGRPVAQLGPAQLGDGDLGEKLYELSMAGVIGQEIRERRPLEPFEPIVPVAGTAPASDVVLEDRGERF